MYDKWAIPSQRTEGIGCSWAAIGHRTHSCYRNGSACFALSCKHFYNTFRSILKDERLQLRQSFSKLPFILNHLERQPEHNLCAASRPRNGNTASNAHPSTIDPYGRNPKRTVVLNASFSMRASAVYIYIYAAGTGQICPCLRLPLRSRRRVIEKIHEHAVAPVRLAGPYWDGLFSPCQGKPNGFLGHTCATTSFPTIDAPDVAVTVYTELFLKVTYRDLVLTAISEEQLRKDLSRGRISKGWSLDVMNEYSIRTFTKELPPDAFLFICPHMDIMPAIRKVLENRRKSEFSGCARHKNTRVCMWCKVILSFDSDSAVFKVKVTRNLGKNIGPDLGKNTWPDEAWSAHGRPMLWIELPRWAYLACVVWFLFVLMLSAGS